MKRPKTKKLKRPTRRQAIFIKNMIENGGNAAKAALDAGYSYSMANNPQKLTNSVAYSAHLDNVGLTPENLALKHRELLNASRMSEFILPFHPRKKKSKKGTRFSMVPLPHEEIIDLFVGIGKVVRIADDYKHRYHIIYYHAPIGTDRKAGLELAMKAKNLLAPDQFDISLKHEATPEEKRLVDAVMGTLK